MLNVHIAKVDEVLFSGEALYVIVPCSEGEVTILPQHMAFCATLKNGVVRVFSGELDEHGEKKITKVDIKSGGVLEVTPTRATILL